MVATAIPSETPVLTTLPPNAKESKDGGGYIQRFTFNDKLRKHIKLVVSRIDIVISKGDTILVESSVRKRKNLYRVKKVWYETGVIAIKAVRAN